MWSTFWQTRDEKLQIRTVSQNSQQLHALQTWVGKEGMSLSWQRIIVDKTWDATWSKVLFLWKRSDSIINYYQLWKWIRCSRTCIFYDADDITMGFSLYVFTGRENTHTYKYIGREDALTWTNIFKCSCLNYFWFFFPFLSVFLSKNCPRIHSLNMLDTNIWVHTDQSSWSEINNNNVFLPFCRSSVIQETGW